MKWRRRLGLFVVIAAIIAAIAWGFRPQPEPVETAEIRRGPLQVTIEEEGKTRVVDRFVVSAPVSGHARRVAFDVGDELRRGQMILALDPLRQTVQDPRTRAEAEARVTAAQAALAVANERLEAAKIDVEHWESQVPRQKSANEAGLLSDETLEQTESNLRRARASVRTAESSVKVAESDLETARATLQHSAPYQTSEPAETVVVRAPVSGRVLKIFKESEGAVRSGDAIVEIANPRLLEVEVELLSADAVRVGPGTRVLLERWGGDQPLDAQVRTVEPFGFTKISALGVEEQRVRVIIDITSPPELWERLGDGYRVEAKFILWEEANVLQVPQSALFRQGDDWAVFAVNANLAQERLVELGQQSGLQAQVLSGLSEGDVVITHPADTITDGVEVAQHE